MIIIKRDGTVVQFDKQKIVDAINKAFLDVDGQIYEEDTANEIADYIQGIVALNAANEENPSYTVEDIQNIVEEELWRSERPDVARAYTRFRHKRELLRNANHTDESILGIIECCNEETKQENSNKNPTINSVQRDYMAGEVSKDLTNRILLPEEIIKAHKKGIIHFHDADYFAQHMHNCLDRETKFITDKGVRSFYDFKDGDIITVLTKDGNWEKAIVHNYGIDNLYKYTFYNGKKQHTQEVIATENHRWYLKDNSITTNLKIGDKLTKAPNIYNQDEDYENFTDEEKLMWCKGFALGDGTVEFNEAGNKINSTRIRLCGEKDNQWLYRFNIPGCKIRKQIFDNGDHSVVVYNYHKEIPIFKTVNEIKAFINGLYCADGAMATNSKGYRNYRIQSSDKKVIDFIREYAPVAGLYITKENDLTGEKTNFTSEQGRKYTISFSLNPNFSFTYTVLKKEFIKQDEVWCLEVENAHNFVLSNGIVTGNCDLVNLEDMLQNGTVISETLIEKPHSFRTACNIATQIIAQVASSQYGK